MSNNQNPPGKSNLKSPNGGGDFFKPLFTDDEWAKFKIRAARDKELADRIINILLEAGYTYDKMLPVIRLAQQKFIELKKRKKNENKKNIIKTNYNTI